jgi:hypothetical protein
MVLANVRPSQAAFGEAAGIFKSKPTNTSGANVTVIGM